MSPTPDRAQVSFEFLLLSLFVFMTAVGFIMAVSSQMTELSREKDGLFIRDTVNRVREEIHIASEMEDGYIRRFEIPSAINSKNYSIIIAQTQLKGTVGNIVYVTVVPRTEGQPNITSNLIEKRGGMLYLNR